MFVNSDRLPTVKTEYGKVEGIWKLSYDGRQYAVFEGIPYAKPPIGDLRFEVGKTEPIFKFYTGEKIRNEIFI